MKVGTYCWINQYMTIYNNPNSSHSMTFVQGHSDSTFSKIVFSKQNKNNKNTRLFEAKFHMEPLWDIRMKICSNVPGHMTKMASMPIYGRNLQKSPSEPRGRWPMKLGIQYRVLKYYQLCLNDDTGLTLTIFMKWSFFSNASAWAKAYTAYSHVFPSLF